MIEEPTKPTSEQESVKVTTYAPDEKQIQKIKSAQRLNQIDEHQLEEPLDLPNLESSTIEEVLTKLQESNHLPATITPENIDGSIKTLMKILNNLKKNQVIPKPPTPIQTNHANDDYDYSSDEDGKVVLPDGTEKIKLYILFRCFERWQPRP